MRFLPKRKLKRLPAWRCWCADWTTPDDAFPLTKDMMIPHMREPVPDAPVEVCYYADNARKVVFMLKIRTV